MKNRPRRRCRAPHAHLRTDDTRPPEQSPHTAALLPRSSTRQRHPRRDSPSVRPSVRRFQTEQQRFFEGERKRELSCVSSFGRGRHLSSGRGGRAATSVMCNSLAPRRGREGGVTEAAIRTAAAQVVYFNTVALPHLPPLPPLLNRTHH